MHAHDRLDVGVVRMRAQRIDEEDHRADTALGDHRRDLRVSTLRTGEDGDHVEPDLNCAAGRLWSPWQPAH